MVNKVSSSLFHKVKIGNIELKGNLFLAPVAGYSDAAFRSVCIENGAAFTYTEMVSAEALVRNNLKTEILMKRAVNETAYAVQIFGGQEDVMAQAAKIVLESVPPRQGGAGTQEVQRLLRKTDAGDVTDVL